ncbi:hypothetical protein [Candidatus Viadribacter manganicus]|uniref:Lipoprotein n=1 Tax=Candidatus Viadribacter manganicus TaxID=1759059 RepID=A0A1B1AJ76_9PROT|nr:hypothetical protein [Candidatus Viadribacter manganicus]ANP46616.1 hypothetical protein ATE48_12155 [Candidatus Viadribacter manganicus]
MKKLALVALALALTACGQTATPPAPEAPTAAIPTGSFDVFGTSPEFAFIADTSANAMELRMNYETIASATYAPPQTTPSGAQIVSGDLTVDFVTQDCDINGASYPLRVTIQARGQEPVTGCGIERWDTHLLELMPYIDACIAKSPETRWVTYARHSGSNVNVRMRGDGGEQDCVASFANPQSAVSQQRNEDSRVPGEGVAIFVRAPGAQPGGECYDAPEVRSASGELIGWKADPMGC